MRGALRVATRFIHFVCGSRRVNIRLGVLLLIPKSPQVKPFFQNKSKKTKNLSHLG